MPSGRFLAEPGIAPHSGRWPVVWEGDLRLHAATQVRGLYEGAEVLSSTSGPAALERWLVDLMELLGAAGAGVAVALENVFPPLPSEVVLALAGFAAHRGTFSLGEAILWTTAGSVTGALALYGVGFSFGHDRLVRLAAKVPLVDADDILRAEGWFERRAHLAVLGGRLIPVVRSLISLPAGVGRMPVLTFLGYTTIGSLVWNSLFIGAGYHLGARWQLVERYATGYTRLAVGVAVAVAGLLVVRRVVAARRAATGRSDRP